MLPVIYKQQSTLEQYLEMMVTKPSSAVTTAINTLINGMKSSNLFQQFVSFHITVLHTEQASRLNLINPRKFDLIDAGAAPTWVSGVGGAGGFTPNAAAMKPQVTSGIAHTLAGPANLNSLCILFDSGTSGTSTGIDIGDASRILCRIRNTSDAAGQRVNDATTETIASSVTDGSGLFGFERDSDSNKVVYQAGTAIGNVTRASLVDTTTREIFLFGSAATANISTRRCRLFALGGALGASGHSIMNTLWVQFRTDIGCT